MENDIYIAFAGNPNVGKSTVFNSLTGLKQHTGNWTGKTVTTARGTYIFEGVKYTLVDLPGCYSLKPSSAEEEAARDYICFSKPDAVVIICDAVCLERNINLTLQILELCKNAVVCVNLIDEAERKNIKINLKELSKSLGVPVVATDARRKKGMNKLMQSVHNVLNAKDKKEPIFKYDNDIEEKIEAIIGIISDKYTISINLRWVAVRLLEDDVSTIEKINEHTGYIINEDVGIKKLLNSIKSEKMKDKIATTFVKESEKIAVRSIVYGNKEYNKKDRKIDKIFTGKYTGYPIMIVLLLTILWISITGANYPSAFIAKALFFVEKKLLDLFIWAGAPEFLYSMLILGVYRVLAWVISVMLPPMMLFFFLFTLLEDAGYLPRIAFNLDKIFKKCDSCGKQSLTMCMGFGCNAGGVIGCRIIDSPRERLIAIITNSFVPCNGRFPMLIAVIYMFFIGSVIPFKSLFSALILTTIILIGIIMTFLVSKILSVTILKGVPSNFTLELPPYRKPQIFRVLLRSVLDRSLFVLGRAVMVAVPAGFVIFLMANISIKDTTILMHCSNFLDPFARILGLDGVILLAFILGFPANEIVIPIIIMAYMSQGSLVDAANLNELKLLLTDNGWTWMTAVSVMLFSLMHWPCSTTLLSVKKETGSIKWTAVSFIIPTLAGMIICSIFTFVARLFCYSNLT